MNKFYVKDGNNIAYFETVKEVVSFLENVVKLKLKSTRSIWMQHNIDLGHGYDDVLGKTFTESMSSHVDIGVVQSNNKLVRCNIHEATTFKQSEYGD